MKWKIILWKWKIRMRNRIILVNFPFRFFRCLLLLFFFLSLRLWYALNGFTASSTFLKIHERKCIRIYFFIQVKHTPKKKENGRKEKPATMWGSAYYTYQKCSIFPYFSRSLINYLLAYFPQRKWTFSPFVFKDKVQSLCWKITKVCLSFKIFNYSCWRSGLGLV